MTASQALILGIVQGLGEFLPISSSGHLVLLQKLLGINEGALSFDIFVHFGTLISLIIVMRKRLLTYLREPLGHIPIMVVLGTLPTIAIALVFGNIFDNFFETGASLGVGFIFTAMLLLIAESHKKSETELSRVIRGRETRARDARSGAANAQYGLNERRRRANSGKSVTLKGALIVGVAQGIAVTPAVSRSGSTIAAGIMCDFGRPAAIEFAFLMSIPVTLMAVAQDLLKIVLNRGGTADEVLTAASGAATHIANVSSAAAPIALTQTADAAITAASTIGPLEMAIGFFAAVITGYFAARFMLKAIQKMKLTWFSLYTGLIGVLILCDQIFFGVVFDKFF